MLFKINLRKERNLIMTQMNTDFKNHVDREKMLKNINGAIEMINKYKDCVDNYKESIDAIRNIKLSFQTNRKKNITKTQFKFIIKALEKIYVNNSLTEAEKLYHHEMAMFCNEMLERSNI